MSKRPPSISGRLRTGVPIVLLATLLSGCVSLLPKSAPVQLYRFGQAAPAAASTAPDAALVGRDQAALGVILSEVSLPREALGDGILTVTGEKAAYVDGARWLTPAALMFREAAENAFAARARRVRLLDRGEVGAASALLRLDVSEFDVRYDPTGASPPTVVVSVRASLVRADGRRLLQQGFSAVRPAAADRMAAIVQAFDAGSAAVLAQVVDWTDAQTAPLAAELPADAPTEPLPRHGVTLPHPH